MGIRSLRTASISTGIKRSDFWDQSTVLSNPQYEYIATATIASNGNNFSFTGIPSTYKALQIRGLVGTNRSGVGYDSLQMTFNNTGSSYYGGLVYGDSRNYTSNEKYAGNTRMYVGEITGGSVTSFAGFTIDVLDYANTSKSTTANFRGGWDVYNTGSSSVNGAVFFGGGVWDNRTTVSSIEITGGTNNGFRTGSKISIYGIKG